MAMFATWYLLVVVVVVVAVVAVSTVLGMFESKLGKLQLASGVMLARAVLSAGALEPTPSLWHCDYTVTCSRHAEDI